MSIISEHVIQVKASEVSMVSARALELERQGKDIIRLSAGEPDFPTPDHIKMACIKALCDNKTKYPPVIGLPELREAICMKLKRDNALDYSPGQTIVSSGCKQVLYNAMTATLNPGDEVMMVAPYWMTYAGIVQLSRGTPMFIPTRQEDGFKPSALALEKAITPRTKWLFLNSPGNPSGAVYSAEELKRPCRRTAAAPPGLDLERRYLRVSGLRRHKVSEPLEHCPGFQGPFSRGERPLEGLLHDGLAPGLWGRPGRVDQGHVQDPVPIHQRRNTLLPVGRGGGLDRRPFLHPFAQRGVYGQAGPCGVRWPTGSPG